MNRNHVVEKVTETAIVNLLLTKTFRIRLFAFRFCAFFEGRLHDTFVSAIFQRDGGRVHENLILGHLEGVIRKQLQLSR